MLLLLIIACEIPFYFDADPKDDCNGTPAQCCYVDCDIEKSSCEVDTVGDPGLAPACAFAWIACRDTCDTTCGVLGCAEGKVQKK